MNRGVFLAKVRAEFARTIVRPRRDRKLLVRPVVSDRWELFTFFRTLIAQWSYDPQIAKTASNIGDGPAPRNTRPIIAQ
jgi:hypothetical protein